MWTFRWENDEIRIHTYVVLENVDLQNSLLYYTKLTTSSQVWYARSPCVRTLHFVLSVCHHILSMKHLKGTPKLVSLRVSRIKAFYHISHTLHLHPLQFSLHFSICILQDLLLDKSKIGIQNLILLNPYKMINIVINFHILSKYTYAIFP